MIVNDGNKQNHGFGWCSKLAIFVDGQDQAITVTHLKGKLYSSWLSSWLSSSSSSSSSSSIAYEAVDIHNTAKHDVWVDQQLHPSRSNIRGIRWTFCWNQSLNEYKQTVKRMEWRVKTGVEINSTIFSTIRPQSSSSSSSSSSSLPSSPPPITTTSSSSSSSLQSSPITGYKSNSQHHHHQKKKKNDDENQSENESSSKDENKNIPIGYVMKVYSPRKEFVVPWMMGVFISTWFVIMYVYILADFLEIDGCRFEQ